MHKHTHSNLCRWGGGSPGYAACTLVFWHWLRQPLQDLRAVLGGVWLDAGCWQQSREGGHCCRVLSPKGRAVGRQESNDTGCLLCPGPKWASDDKLPSSLTQLLYAQGRAQGRVPRAQLLPMCCPDRQETMAIKGLGCSSAGDCQAGLAP